MTAFLNNNKLLIVVSILFCLFIWKLPLQTQDGPNHKRVAAALARIAESPAEAAVYQDRLSAFHTNVLFPLVYRPLAQFLSTDAYEKLFMGLFLLLLPIAYRIFLSVWSPASVSLWVIILPMWFHMHFIMGFYNFFASVSLSLLALALLKKGLQTKKWLCWLAFVPCVWILFLAHPFSLIILSLCLGLLWIVEFRRQWISVGAYGVVILIFFTVGFLVPFFQSSSHSVPDPYTFQTVPALLAGFLINSFAAYSIPHFLVIVPFFVMLAIFMFTSARSVAWHQKIFWIVMMASYCFFPHEGKSGNHLNERFLIYIWLFLPLGLQLTTKRVRQVQGLTLVTTVVMAAFVYWGMWRVNEVVVRAESVMEELPAQSRLYSFNFDLGGPALNFASLMHLWANSADDRVVFSPYLFAHMDLMPLARRRRATATYFPATSEDWPTRIAKNLLCEDHDIIDAKACAVLRHNAYQEMIGKASYYDYWLINEPSSEFMALIQGLPGLTKVNGDETLSLWHYKAAKSFSPPILSGH